MTFGDTRQRNNILKEKTNRLCQRLTRIAYACYFGLSWPVFIFFFSLLVPDAAPVCGMRRLTAEIMELMGSYHTSHTLPYSPVGGSLECAGRRGRGWDSSAATASLRKSCLLY